MMILSRRTLFGASVATAAFALAPPFAKAAAPFRNQLPPAWHRFRIGEFEATVISDGALPLGPPGPAFPVSPAQEMDALLRANFLPTDITVLEQNVLVLNTGRHLVLFDTGMGTSMGPEVTRQYGGPNAGRLLDTMRAAGIEPAQIDVVAVTHAHCDHCWGLVDEAGNRVFPNAQVALSEIDLRFWTDDGNKRGAAFMGPFIDGAKKNLAAYRDRMIMVRDGQEVVPGVSAIHTPGHTLGHHVYAVTSGRQTVVNTGDLAHHYVLLLRRPMWEFAFDTDPKQSAQTRSRMLDRFSNDRTAILSYHFPWPGLGNVTREGEGFAWHPAPMNVTTLG
jgi:glyoxylase-like metal-dependent hydrolase (beta-lactamase superfamily II)